MGESGDIKRDSRQLGIRVEKGEGFSQLAWNMQKRKSSKSSAKNGLSMEEVRKHNDLLNDGWMVVKGTVYRISDYAPYHPGGFFELAYAVGDDASLQYDEVHSWVNAARILESSIVGTLVDDNVKEDAKLPALTKQVSSWTKAKLVSVKEVATFQYLYSWEIESGLPSYLSQMEEWNENGLPVQIHLVIKAGKRYIMRPYTPLLNPSSLDDSLLPMSDLNPNHLHTIVKIYDGGRFTSKLSQFKPGNSIDCTFVSSHLVFKHDTLLINGMRGETKKQGKYSKLGLVVGGTGVLPAIQIIQYHLARTDSEVEIWLLYTCRLQTDILFAKWFEQLAKKFKDRFHFLFVLPKFESKKHSSHYVEGKLGEDFFRKYPTSLPPINGEEDDDVRILLSGPPGFEDYGPKDSKKIASLRVALMRVGYDKSCIENF